MAYEVLVCKVVGKAPARTEHYFATDPRSILSERDLTRILQDFAVRFPESEGFRISATRLVRSGYSVDVEKAMRGDFTEEDDDGE